MLISFPYLFPWGQLGRACTQGGLIADISPSRWGSLCEREGALPTLEFGASASWCWINESWWTSIQLRTLPIYSSQSPPRGRPWCLLHKFKKEEHLKRRRRRTLLGWVWDPSPNEPSPPQVTCRTKGIAFDSQLEGVWASEKSFSSTLRRKKIGTFTSNLLTPPPFI